MTGGESFSIHWTKVKSKISPWILKNPTPTPPCHSESKTFRIPTAFFATRDHLALFFYFLLHCMLARETVGVHFVFFFKWLLEEELCGKRREWESPSMTPTGSMFFVCYKICHYPGRF